MRWLQIIADVAQIVGTIVGASWVIKKLYEFIKNMLNRHSHSGQRGFLVKFSSAISSVKGIKITNILLAILVVGVIYPYATLIHFPVTTKVSLSTLIVASPDAAQQATKTATMATYNPYSSPGGSLTLDDPLRDNSRGYNWANTPIANLEDGQCQFITSTYSLKSNGQNSCVENALSFSNFVYEVQMTTSKGNDAGIIFRYRTSTSLSYSYYYFHVSVTGQCTLDLVNKNEVKTLFTGLCPSFKQGPNQWNLLAVKALHTSITVYVNWQLIFHVDDATNSIGFVGIGVGSPNDNSQIEARFRYARVWTF